MIQFLMQDAAKKGGLCFWPVKFWRGRLASAMHSGGDTWVTVQSLHCRMLLVEHSGGDTWVTVQSTLQNVAGRAACGCTNLCVCGIRSSVKDHEFQCSGFRPSVITTNTTASACHNWFRQWHTGGGVQTPKILKALQNRAKLNLIVKTVKNCWI